MSDILHLNLKKQYFDEIKYGNKTQEFRLYNDFWKKRLLNRSYRIIQIKLGYPKSNDYNRIEARPYRGYQLKTITHPHFGPDPVDVFAIWVN